MVYELINYFYIDLFERPKRLGDLSFPIDLDESPFGFLWKKPEQKWLIPSASVLQLSKHFSQDWPLGFAKNEVPKRFKIARF